MITKSRLTWGALLLLTALSGPGCNSSTAADAGAALSAAGITLSKDPLTFTDVTSTSLTVNWAAGKSSTVAASKLLYQVFYTEVDPGLTKPTVASIKASGWTLAGPAVANITSMSITNLSPSTTYYFTVISSDGGSNTAVYPVTAQTTGFTLADATLTASAITGTGLTLNWAPAVDDATLAAKISYNVYYSTLATLTTVADWTNAAKATAVDSAATAIITKDITGLSVNTTYYFMVIASDPTGNSALYDSLTETTANVDTTAPVPGGSSTPAVATLSFTGATTTGFTVDWAAATDDVSKASALVYEVFYANSASDLLSTTALDTAVKAATAHSLGKDTGIVTLVVMALPSNTTYNVGVMVTDEAGNRALYSSGTIATTAVVVADTTPPVIGSPLLSASSVTTTGLTLSWDVASDTITAQSALQYLVYYTTGAGSTFDTVAHIQANGTAVGIFAVNDPTTPTQAITGLTAATTYQFQVLVRDAAGNLSMYTTKQQATASPPNIYMFASGSTHTGNLGGRDGADAICWSSPNKASGCTVPARTRAFLSVSPSDYISNFPTQYSGYAFPAAAITDRTGAYQIAANWSALMQNNGACNGSGTCTNQSGGSASLQTVMGASAARFWTGATTTGGYDATSGGSQCSAWSSTSGPVAWGGFTNAILQNGWSLFGLCGNSYEVMCVCW